MAETVKNLDEAKIDSEVFQAYTKEILGHMREAYKLKQESDESTQLAKDSLEVYSKTSGIPLKELKSYMKARFEDTLPKENEDKVVGTGAVINRGNLFQILNSALEAV